MRKPLTQLKVDRMRPDHGKPVEVPDHLYPALRLIVRPSGSRSFAMRTRINGRTAKITFGSDVGLDLKKAREKTKAYLADIAAGLDPRQSKRQLPDTLGALVAEHLEAVAKLLRPRTLEERRRHLMRDWAPLHGLPLAKLNRALIFDHMQRIGRAAGEVAAHRATSDLSACISWAQSIGRFDQNVVNPAWRLPRLVKERSRERTLDLEELRAIWTAAGDGDHGVIVKLLMLLGARRGEVAGMRWSELDLEADAPVWRVPGARTKNGEMLELPLPHQAVELLRARPRVDGRDLVFGDAGPFSGFSRSKRRLDQRSGVSRWRAHDLRRTLQSELHELGVSSDVTERLLNHKRRGVQAVYDRAKYREPKRLALQRWSDHLLGTGGGQVIDLSRARETA